MAASRSCRIPELQNLVTDKTPKTAPQASDAEIDEKDVEILMAQASCDHDKAVRLLKEANGDLINASASISSSFQPCSGDAR
jgi:NACalpha-BTF3-like transcription factor